MKKAFTRIMLLAVLMASAAGAKAENVLYAVKSCIDKQGVSEIRVCARVCTAQLGASVFALCGRYSYKL